MNISLSTDAQRLVRQRLKSGEFDSPEDYLRALILNDQKRRVRRNIESTLLRRQDRSQAVEMDEADVAAIGKKVARIVARRKLA